jgi:hypothetical protein
MNRRKINRDSQYDQDKELFWFLILSILSIPVNFLFSLHLPVWMLQNYQPTFTGLARIFKPAISV